MSARVSVLIAVTACAGPAVAPAPTTGTIMGLVRDRASGEEIALAELHLRRDGQLSRGAETRSTADGFYDFDRLSPGRYALTAYYAGEVVEVANIDVVAGRVAPVDVAFELGRAEPVVVDFGNPRDGAIDHYRPPRADPSTGLIEGTVSDSATRERVVGAVVVAALGNRVVDTLQAVTDAHGRFVFAGVPPGTYTVSAYYSIARRGQIEVQRNSLAVRGGEAVVVPLWIELEAQ